VTRIQKLFAAAAVAGGLAFASSASAQLPFTTTWTGGPTVAAGSLQTNYPYPGQCVAATDAATIAMFPGLPPCTLANAPSFDCPKTGGTNQTAAAWGACGAVTAFAPATAGVLGALAPTSPKYVWEVLNPVDYTADTTTYAGADYYELAVHESWGFQAIAGAGLFPDPTRLVPAGAAVPDGKQWTGIVGAAGPLYTPIWGVGQKQTAGLLAAGTKGTVETALGVPAGTPTGWSANNFYSTWPSISVRAKTGTPVVVKWVNEFPNNHVFCPHPEAADWPCAIDRTFMGVKATLDPAVAASQLTGIAPDGVNQFGSPQQPDNSWVTHLHGGEVPPSTDGFAEKWFGNATTAPKYNDPTKARFVNPPFENPSKIELVRPATNSDTYAYPMVQEEATIWFHDHTLGKTHHNVIAGPAGFFPVKDDSKHGPIAAGVCNAAAGQTCDYTWLDPVTEPRNALNQPIYDLFLALQDRSFNDDGSINFSNGLGQTQPMPLIAPGQSPVTPGLNPMVHPTWIPEYFGDHALVNGVIWPKATVEPGWYRIRLVDGSDSRCWQIGFTRTAPTSAVRPAQNIPFWVIANDQGYMQQPVRATGNSLLMCPGERYEILINFGAVPGIRYPLAAGTSQAIYMTNIAPAPYPVGVAPFPATVLGAANPFAEMNQVMQFKIVPAGTPHPVKALADLGFKTGSGIPTCATGTSLTYPGTVGCMPALSTVAGVVASGPVDPNYAKKDLRNTTRPMVTRQVYLNERLDGVTLMPLGMQLNGVPFEYKVTETPKVGTVETWKFVNLTVDAHPMHPHLVQHQIVSRQNFNVGAYKARLCGSTTCQPGGVPGNEMQVVPDVTLNLGPAAAVLVTAASVDGGFKDATRAMPGQVTTIVADWTPRWKGANPASGLTPTAPGTQCPNPKYPGTASAPEPKTVACAVLKDPASINAKDWVYEPVTSGPYVWHCHINSHEDSEMMRTSLVVP
jgi:FtsP/CotA-like multicopper oxidase with cupredoxin domain